MSAVHNTSRPEPVVRKKSNSVSYHTVHELVAMGKSLDGNIPKKEKFADLMTKVLYGQKRRYFMSNIVQSTDDSTKQQCTDVAT